VVSPSRKKLFQFQFWYVDRGYDGMPYDPIHGQGQGHECLKATQ